MSLPPESELDDRRARELIAEVWEEDRRRVSRAIADAVKEVEDQWIEAPVIADALVIELIEFAQKHNSVRELPQKLRAIAQTIEARAHPH